jgi:hypothetical protein
MNVLRRKWKISRRACLRGIGATLALPALDAMFLDDRAIAQSAMPCRFFTIFVPHGIDMPSFTPALPPGRSRRDDFVDPGFDMASRRVLAPLAAFRDDLNVVSGLGNAPANKGDFNGSHARATGTCLTCSEVRTTSSFDEIENGISVDQVLAGAIGARTAFASLELGVRAGELDGDCEDGYSCAYINNISWSGPARPAPKQTNPADVFDRLVRFAMPSGETPPAPVYTGDESILAAMREDANRLQALVGADDRARVAEYLEGVRAIERRVAEFRGMPGAAAGCTVPARPESPAGYEAHVRLMLDMVAFAFRCDLTRVATFMMENPFNSRDYNFLGVSGNSHEISHHGGNADKIEKIRTINEWQSEQVAYFAAQLRDTVEGTSTLLDNSIVYYTSEFGDGDDHYHHDLPIVILGKGAGAFATGRHIHYGGPVGGDLDDVSRSKPLANLYLNVLDAMGAPQATFGDNGTARLAELDA